MRQRIDRFRIIDGAGENQVSDGRIEPWGMFEEKRVMFLDALEMTGEFRGKVRGLPIAAKAREAGELLGIGRQTLRLLVGDHLQPVLDVAQIEIGGGQIVAGFGA